MKMKLFFRISVLVLCILMSLSSFADDKKDRISVEDIEWSANNQRLEDIVSTTPGAPKITYLYATTPNKFVTVGGRYGAQPILAEVGMNFYVEEVGDDPNNSDPGHKRYYIHSWVHNPTTAHEDGTADYLGVEPTMDKDQHITLPDGNKSIYLFVDRGKDNYDDNHTISAPERVQWYFTPVEKNGYKISFLHQTTSFLLKIGGRYSVTKYSYNHYTILVYDSQSNYLIFNTNVCFFLVIEKTLIKSILFLLLITR